jgi:hypothetical protein
MPNDEKFNLFTCFLSVSLCSFSAFWRAENAISAHHNIRHKLYVVNDFGYVCVGIRKIYLGHLFPLLLLRKSLLE